MAKTTSPSRTIEVDGRRISIAVSILERTMWIEQVQDFALPAALGTANSLTRYINNRSGGTFVGVAQIAECARLGERQTRTHLNYLEKIGAILRQQRRRRPAIIFLIHPRDWQCAAGLNHLQDRQKTAGQESSLDRQSSALKTGNRHFLNGLKSISCESITQLFNSVTVLPPGNEGIGGEDSDCTKKQASDGAIR